MYFMKCSPITVKEIWKKGILLRPRSNVISKNCSKRATIGRGHQHESMNLLMMPGWPLLSGAYCLLLRTDQTLYGQILPSTSIATARRASSVAPPPWPLCVINNCSKALMTASEIFNASSGWTLRSTLCKGCYEEKLTSKLRAPLMEPANSVRYKAVSA